MDARLCGQLLSSSFIVLIIFTPCHSWRFSAFSLIDSTVAFIFPKTFWGKKKNHCILGIYYLIEWLKQSICLHSGTLHPPDRHHMRKERNGCVLTPLEVCRTQEVHFHHRAQPAPTLANTTTQTCVCKHISYLIYTLQ